MKYSESFEEIYDKISPTKTEGVCEVQDKEGKQAFKTLRCEDAQGRFVRYDTSVLKGWKKTFSNLSAKLKDCDCDGWLIHESAGQETLILAELKTTGGTKTWTTAFQQLVYSFLKVHMLSSLCEGYDLSKIQVHFVLACQNEIDTPQESEVDHSINATQQLQTITDAEKKQGESPKKKKFLGNLLPELRKKQQVQFNLGEIRLMNNVPLPALLSQKTIRLSLVVAETSQSDSATLIL